MACPCPWNARHIQTYIVGNVSLDNFSHPGPAIQVSPAVGKVEDVTVGFFRLEWWLRTPVSKMNFKGVDHSYNRDNNQVVCNVHGKLNPGVDLPLG